MYRWPRRNIDGAMQFVQKKKGYAFHERGLTCHVRHDLCSGVFIDSTVEFFFSGLVKGCPLAVFAQIKLLVVVP